MVRHLTIFISHPSELLTDSLPHGDGLIADAFIRALANRGHRLYVAVEKAELRTPYPPNVTLCYVRQGCTTKGVGRRVQFALAVRRLHQRLSKTVTFDLIHQLNPVVAGLSLFLNSRRQPLFLGPLVPDWPLVRGGDGRLQAPSLKQQFEKRLKRRVWSWQQTSAAGLCLSSPAARTCLSGHVEEHKLYTIPYGVNTSDFNYTEPPETLTLLFVGSIMHHKGIFLLLEAFRSVLAEFPDCHLLMAGTGPEEKDVHTFIRDKGLAERVSLLGPIERPSLPELYRRSTLVCMPSYGEPFGIVALEAMASGRPLVGTNASGLGFLIEETGGISVPMGNEEALTAAILKVLRNRQLAVAMGQANRVLAVQQYSWARIADRWEQAYSAVLQESRS